MKYITEFMKKLADIAVAIAGFIGGAFLAQAIFDYPEDPITWIFSIGGIVLAMVLKMFVCHVAWCVTIIKLNEELQKNRANQ